MNSFEYGTADTVIGGTRRSRSSWDWAVDVGRALADAISVAGVWPWALPDPRVALGAEAVPAIGPTHSARRTAGR